uniref:Uncharacterized protein n=1 Tax=Rhizophora mucronata TaxID=61149 RepID=A0A2P2MM50_RHIMU
MTFLKKKNKTKQNKTKEQTDHIGSETPQPQLKIQEKTEKERWVFNDFKV